MTTNSTTPTRRAHPSTKSEIPGHKRCSRCDLDLPATTEYFGIDNGKAPGITAECRKCLRLRNKTKKLKVWEVLPATKACTLCGLEKPLSAEYFSRNKASSTGFSSACRPCHNDRGKRSKDQLPNKTEINRASNQRKLAKQRAAVLALTHMTCEHCEKSLPKDADHFRVSANHRTGFRPICHECLIPHEAALLAGRLEVRPEKSRAAYHTRKLKDPIGFAASQRAKRLRRRDKEAGLAKIPAAFVYAIVERQQCRCHYCDRKMLLVDLKTSSRQFTLDHVIPLERGGTNEESNLVGACRGCNCSKRDEWPWEWLGITLCAWINTNRGQGLRGKGKDCPAREFQPSQIMRQLRSL